MKKFLIRYFLPSLLLAALHSACRERPSTAFVAVSPSQTQILFENQLTETEYFNIIEYLYFYNGGGVAIGDINNDGLDDIFFTANQLQNKLYLNKGDFLFEDITEQAGAAGVGNWKTGASMADVNGDGLLDIFVCGVGNYKYFNGKNQLLINNGNLTFTDMTDAYGLHFQGFSTQSAFFDYDLDGDLDMYLLNHSVHAVGSHGFSHLRHEKDSLAGDRLYRNELIPHGAERFTDVTAQAGIFSSRVGYGLGVGIADIDVDGYPDIYVSNDFHENDYLYINGGDGTFRDKATASFGHVSRFSMGNDIADINNDGLADIITLDMLPRDEQVIKTTAGEDPYDIYMYKLRFGYHHQYARNALQLNQGKGTQGEMFFSDIAPLAGVEATDWSWAPLLADFDNDGRKDLFVANGIKGRPNDLDYINFISSDSAQQYYQYEAFVRNMPSGKVPNYFFRNEDNLRFKDVTDEWIGMEPSISTGAAYGDLDNDGDLDLVVNNIGAIATIYRNDTRKKNWLQVNFAGAGANKFGIGAKVLTYSGKSITYHEQFLSRGFQSSVSPRLHVGLGTTLPIDSLHIIWPDGKTESVRSPSINKIITASYARASGHKDPEAFPVALLSPEPAPAFNHHEDEFDAFAEEKLIPHMLSTQGPKMCSADLNADDLDDFFVGGATGQSGAIYLQQPTGEFHRQLQPFLALDSACEDTGAVFFDADADGHQDLIVVSGGQHYKLSDPRLKPRLYVNDGTGVFRMRDAFPDVAVNASCVATTDFDGDGDSDVFIGGRVVPGAYGITPKSYLLENEGGGVFRDVSDNLPEGGRLGMVTDAVWTDVDDDHKPDLVVAGEWMPLTVLVLEEGGFFDRTADVGLRHTHGWWNTLHPVDIDQDGDVDLLAGNLGKNSRLRATTAQPVSLYAGDIDKNGGMDHLLTYFNQGEQHPFISRDQLVKQVPSFRRAFLKYSNFRNVSREQIIPSGTAQNFGVKHAYEFASMLLMNEGGSYRQVELPPAAQMFPIFAFETGDFNRDGLVDVLATGNLFAVQPDFGRYDAGYGITLIGTAGVQLDVLPHQVSGFLVRGEGRDIQAIRRKKDTAYIISRNNDSLLMFR